MFAIRNNATGNLLKCELEVCERWYSYDPVPSRYVKTILVDSSYSHQMFVTDNESLIDNLKDGEGQGGEIVLNINYYGGDKVKLQDLKKVSL